MGLDFLQCDASWSYSGFNDFRRRLARDIGFDLNEMMGFSKGFHWQDGYAPGTRPWSEIDDPIVPLLNHSDCEGELSPQECAQVAPRLRELVTPWPEHDYDRHNALVLAEAMGRCACDGEALVFC